MYKPDGINTHLENYVLKYYFSGMIVNRLKGNLSDPSLYVMTIAWTPSSLDLGSNLVCYTPVS